ncbi:branched-chain amino acid ABC transporter substrate-binding protein [Chelatococcus reniformis]|uniref:Branched-chain amino acid ABC transporter substrate-binding protein n=2 Tax=Chelatococcus reniformis TaxID=1494448 RepID=A0A916U6M4_9HYPH|nr:branched-chain amino acid ABC transporter substrate-binding protein [Chelatococcus reniformis]
MGRAAVAADAPGVTDTEIRLGTLQPLSGPASAYGILGYAFEGYFTKVNDEGGINGRKIKVLLRDDALSPPKAVEQTRALVEQDGIFALFGQSGTPTGVAVQKYLHVKGIPQLFVMSGSHVFQEPKNAPLSLPGLPTYFGEAKLYARAILQDNPNARIGIFYQNDDFGKDYVKGVQIGLGDKADKLIVAKESYELTDPTVDSKILALKASGADTLVMGSYSKQTSQALQKMGVMGWRPKIYLSYIGSAVNPTLKNAGFENAKGVVTAAVLKDPTDVRWKDDPETLAWLAWMDKYYPRGDKTSGSNVFGYVIGDLIRHIIEKTGKELTQERLMATAKQVRDYRPPMLLPDISLTITPDNYSIYNKMQLQEFDGTAWRAVGKPISTN